MHLIVLGFVSAVLFMDLILTLWLIGIVGGVFLLPLLTTLYLLFKSWPPKDECVKSGLVMGKGADLDNPDAPKVLDVILEDKALNLGFLAVGGPGSGKTVAGIVFLEYFTKVRKQGWVYWDGKGDKDIYQSCMACGAQPDYFFSSELPSSDTVNVLSGPIENVLERLGKVLIQSESDYYRNAQRAALRAVLPLLKSLSLPVTLRDLYVFMKEEEAAHFVINLARKKKIPADTIKVADDYFKSDDDTRKNDINGLLTRMQLFVFGEGMDRINAYEPTLDLVYAAKNNKRVYMHLPFSTMAKDISIMLTEQIGVIAKDRQLYDSQRTLWPQCFDDWGAFFYSASGAITARCRSANMPVSYLFQSKGQTDRVESGGNFTKEVTDNIGGFFALRINGQDTADWAAKQFGEYESNELQVTNNERFSGQGLSSRIKPRVNGQALKNLDAGETYISCLQSGEQGASSNKIYRARFPLPDFSNASTFDWPIITKQKANDDCEGLHLWRDFMNPDRLKNLKKIIAEKAMAQMKTPAENVLEEVDYL